MNFLASIFFSTPEDEIKKAISDSFSQKMSEQGIVDFLKDYIPQLSLFRDGKVFMLRHRFSVSAQPVRIGSLLSDFTPQRVTDAYTRLVMTREQVESCYKQQTVRIFELTDELNSIIREGTSNPVTEIMEISDIANSIRDLLIYQRRMEQEVGMGEDD